MVNLQLTTFSRQAGFTLVEISIVLVIIGLLVGGIFAGQNLMKSSEIKRILKRSEEISGAVESFRSRFNALPGDFKTATSTWGTQHATHATCITTASSTQVTCNGNGNGQIGESGQTYERYRLWQHLANASLIEGSFNGTSAIPSEEGMYWGLYWLGDQSGNAALFNGAYHHALILDPDPMNLTGTISASAFTPLDMEEIDRKMDDGAPATGKIVARLGPCSLKANLSANATFSDLDAVYNLDSKDAVCSALMRDFTGR